MTLDKAFFKKHQSLLVRLANSPWTRWLLGLHRLPKPMRDSFRRIDGITPNSLHVVKTDGTVDNVFFVRQRFAESLAYNLSPFVYFQNKRMIWRLSPVGVLGMLTVILMPKIGFLGFIGTTNDIYTGSGDGVVSLNGLANNLWATWHDATAGNYASDSSTTGNDGSMGGNPSIYVDGNNRYAGGRAFIFVDTSAVGTDSVLSASLFLCTDFLDRNTWANNNVEITESTVSSNTALATGDFDLVNNVKWATGILHDSLAAVGSFNEFVFNSTGYEAINHSGYSKYAVRYAYDVDNSAPALGGGRRIVFGFRFSEYAGSSSDPYLRVVSVSTASGSWFMH